MVPNSSKYILYFGGCWELIPEKYVLFIIPLIPYFLKDSLSLISTSDNEEPSVSPVANEGLPGFCDSANTFSNIHLEDPRVNIAMLLYIGNGSISSTILIN